MVSLDSRDGGPEPNETQDQEDVVRSAGSDDISVLAGLGMPTLVLDTDGSIQRCNDHALDLFATSGDDAVGVEPAALVDDDSDVTDIAAEAMADGTAIEDREELFVVDGRRVHVSRTVRPVYEDGRCVGAVEIDRDIGARIERRDRTDALEQYQREVLTDLQGKLGRLGDGDLTIDVAVAPPSEDYEELQAVYEEFSAMNEDLDRAVTNFRTVVATLTDQASSISDTSTSLSASSEEVTASIQQIDASAAEMADGAEQLAAETATVDGTVDDLSAAIEEITA